MNITTEILGRTLALTLLPIIGVFNIFGSRADGKGVWLIGENRGDCLEDNGYAFFQHCLRNHPDRAVYFLIKKSSPFYQSQLPAGGRLVSYGSVRHMRLFVEAGVHFYTHTYKDLMYRRFFELFGRKKRLVYLHHGTLGFKKFDAFYDRNKNIMDIFTVGSELERDILVEQAQVDGSRVKVTGYARSDLMPVNQILPSNQILFMPTHRQYLQGAELAQFIGRIDEFLRSSALNDLLLKHDQVLKVYFHQHTQLTLSVKFPETERIQVVSLGSESVRDLMCSSSLMITDYSSVSWDFLSIGRPVLFFRPDIEEYLAARDSYIDLRDETYGEIAYDEGKLLELLEDYLKGVRKFSPDTLRKGGIVPCDGRSSNSENIYQLTSNVLGEPAPI